MPLWSEQLTQIRCFANPTKFWNIGFREVRTQFKDIRMCGAALCLKRSRMENNESCVSIQGVKHSLYAAEGSGFSITKYIRWKIHISRFIHFKIYAVAITGDEAPQICCPKQWGPNQQIHQVQNPVFEVHSVLIPKIRC